MCDSLSITKLPKCIGATCQYSTTIREKKSKIPTAGYFCDPLTRARTELKSCNIGTVAKSQLASVILSTHKHLSILGDEH